MKREKFNIKIERNLLRLNSKGKITTAVYPRAFGNKEKNNFITTDTEDYILKIKTPICQSISDVFNKLEEITNVVYVELYNLKEIVWPFSNFENIELTNKITLSIDKEYYEEIDEVLNKADNIYIFAITNTASITYDFQYKMKYLYKKVHIIDNPELFAFTLPTIKKDDCCLLISYSGETFEIFHLGNYLRKRHFTAISITSIGDNSLLHMTDYHLYISTREKLSSKI